MTDRSRLSARCRRTQRRLMHGAGETAVIIQQERSPRSVVHGEPHGGIEPGGHGFQKRQGGGAEGRRQPARPAMDQTRASFRFLRLATDRGTAASPGSDRPEALGGRAPPITMASGSKRFSSIAICGARYSAASSTHSCNDGMLFAVKLAPTAHNRVVESRPRTASRSAPGSTHRPRGSRAARKSRGGRPFSPAHGRSRRHCRLAPRNGRPSIMMPRPSPCAEIDEAEIPQIPGSAVKALADGGGGRIVLKGDGHADHVRRCGRRRRNPDHPDRVVGPTDVIPSTLNGPGITTPTPRSCGTGGFSLRLRRLDLALDDGKNRVGIVRSNR